MKITYKTTPGVLQTSAATSLFRAVVIPSRQSYVVNTVNTPSVLVCASLDTPFTTMHENMIERHTHNTGVAALPSLFNETAQKFNTNCDLSKNEGTVDYLFVPTMTPLSQPCQNNAGRELLHRDAPSPPAAPLWAS